MRKKDMLPDTTFLWNIKLFRLLLRAKAVNKRGPMVEISCNNKRSYQHHLKLVDIIIAEIQIRKCAIFDKSFPKILRCLITNVIVGQIY